jgi:cephalosporin hydroxylase
MEPVPQSLTAEELAKVAVELFEKTEFREALQALDVLEANGFRFQGMNHLRALMSTTLNRWPDAIKFEEEELRQHPDNATAQQELEALRSVQRDSEMRHQPARSWHTSLPRQSQLMVEAGTHLYHYRSIPFIKNPFDFAIYTMMVWEIKPRTIIEVGSFAGGSALWLGDMLSAYGIDGHIYSIDINKVQNVEHPLVTFMQGNGRDLSATLTESMIADLPRPLLVIEDADHTYDTTLKVLSFFDRYLRPGEYIVVEDCMTCPGPRRAIQEFLTSRQSAYGIDQRYCDFYGYNTTWAINGFLRKLS